jgi:hypothetical protein
MFWTGDITHDLASEARLRLLIRVSRRISGRAWPTIADRSTVSVLVRQGPVLIIWIYGKSGFLCQTIRSLSTATGSGSKVTL